MNAHAWMRGISSAVIMCALAVAAGCGTQRATPIANSVLPATSTAVSHHQSAPSAEASAGSPGLSLKWQYATGGPIYYSSPAIGPDGTIYVGNGAPFSPTTPTQRLYAINPDGTYKWSYDVGVHVHSPVFGADGTIYFQDNNGSLYALTSNGALKWRYTTSNAADVGEMVPALGSDGTIYISAYYNVTAIKPDGTFKWISSLDMNCVPLAPSIRSGPAVGPDGTIYVGAYGYCLPPTGGTFKGALLAMNPDGTRKWEYLMDGSLNVQWIFSSPAVASDGTIYLGAETGMNDTDVNYVFAVKPDGTLKWRYDVPGGRTIRSSPTIGADGTIYIGTKAGNNSMAELLALNPDGTLKWLYALTTAQADIYCTPTVGADGRIFFGAETGQLYALNPDGTLSASFSANNGINWTSPAIAADGTIYIGNNSGTLFAISSSTLGLASSPWPKFHRDNQNTGRLQQSATYPNDKRHGQPVNRQP